MAAERLFIVSYDIANQKRWRRVFTLMKGYGEWLQLSVFQCRLTARCRAEIAARLEKIIHHTEDQVVLIDIGPADQAKLHVEALGKTYAAPERQAIVI